MLTCLESVGDLSQFGDWWLLVDKLLLIQVSKPRAIKTHPEVGPKHSLDTEDQMKRWDDLRLQTKLKSADLDVTFFFLASLSIPHNLIKLHLFLHFPDFPFFILKRQTHQCYTGEKH